VGKYLRGGPPSLSEQLRDRWFWALVQVLLQTYDYEWIDNPLAEQQDAVFRNVNDVALDQLAYGFETEHLEQGVVGDMLEVHVPPGEGGQALRGVQVILALLRAPH
jgi:hypothetical protein